MKLFHQLCNVVLTHCTKQAEVCGSLLEWDHLASDQVGCTDMRVVLHLTHFHMPAPPSPHIARPQISMFIEVAVACHELAHLSSLTQSALPASKMTIAAMYVHRGEISVMISHFSLQCGESIPVCR